MRLIAALGVLVSVSALASDALAQAATQFDLVCSGSRQIGLEAEPQPYLVRFRVDLGGERYCWQNCDRTESIVEIAPDRIWLMRDDEGDRRRFSEESINRVTGQLDQLVIDSRRLVYIKTTAQCVTEPFSGFPQTRF